MAVKYLYIRVEYRPDPTAPTPIVKDFSVSTLDDLFNFLVTEGFYDDIKVTKDFSVPKAVMKRMKGETE